jgi:membrane protease YdiL (CAAX protease family)
MLTRLIDAKVPAPLLSSGVIWGAWHVPFILGGGYSPALATPLGLLTFFACTIAAAVIAGVVRLHSGSVWPAVLFHATWNSFMQDAFDAFTEQPTMWLGESGVLVAGATGVAAAVVYWRWAPAASGFTTAGGNTPAPTDRHRRP